MVVKPESTIGTKGAIQTLKEYYIASVSWGKDSLYMLLRLLEEGAPLNEVAFYDTGMEFQAIYNTRDAILPLLKEHGVKYTEFKPKRPFEYDMLEKPVKSKNGDHLGYSWCGGSARWGTAGKQKTLDAHAKKYSDQGYIVFQYVGIAADEPKRIKKLAAQKNSTACRMGRNRSGLPARLL